MRRSPGGGGLPQGCDEACTTGMARMLCHVSPG